MSPVVATCVWAVIMTSVLWLNRKESESSPLTTLFLYIAVMLGYAQNVVVIEDLSDGWQFITAILATIFSFVILQKRFKKLLGWPRPILFLATLGLGVFAALHSLNAIETNLRSLTQAG